MGNACFCKEYSNPKEIKEIILNVDYKQIQNRFNEIQKSIDAYSKDIEEKNNLIPKFQIFLDKLNADLNQSREKMNISIFDNYKKENNITDSFDIDKAYKLKSIIAKINDFKNIIEDLKINTLKKVENLYELIQNSLNDYSYNDIIDDKLKELEEINKYLEEKKGTHDKIKEEIEKGIEEIQTKVKNFIKNSEIIFTSAIVCLNLNSDEVKLSTRFLQNSMLLDLKEYLKSDNIFKSTNLFKEDDNNENQECQNLLRKNWDEKCYIYDDYDLHDVNYEIKAVGLPPNAYYSSASFPFYIGNLVEIIEFEVDGKKSEYKYENYSLKFEIKLKNMESNKIHIKYKEKLPSNENQGENSERKFYRSKYYGLDVNNKGQMAKFTLIIKCDFEVISFGQLFLVKINDKEYTWGGKVPPEGKRTLVNLSKSRGNFNIEKITRIESKENKPLEKTQLTIPFAFEGGNNKIINIEYSSQQTKDIEKKDESKKYEIKFINIKETYGEFIIKGELMNKCNGEWICDLTDEEIEKHIPEDYKINKKKFKEFAEKIIKDYDETHKDDEIEVTNIFKIGKWVKENIKYDISYKGKNNISAFETYNNKVGVCHHFTKLFNAFMYSLGFKCVYVSGYVAEKRDYFSSENGHAWSLIKINGKWLPFDSTWGIFTGKLPICHIFSCYFPEGIKTNGTDDINIKPSEIKGKFIK